MTAWPTVKLGEVCRFESGGTPDRKNPDYWGDGTPWITGADIVGEYISPRSEISAAALRGSAAREVPTGTVLLVTRTSVGKAVRADRVLAFSQDITAVWPEADRLDGQYLVHFLRASGDYFARHARGATIKGVKRDDVANLPMPLPPLSEQRRIADVLDRADALRRVSDGTMSKIASTRASLHRSRFGGEATRRLEVLGQVQGGLQVTSKRSVNPIDVPYLRVANVFQNRLDLSEIKRIRVTPKELDRVSLNAGDLLFVEGHGNKDEVGRCAVWTEEVTGMVHQNHLIRFRADQDVLDPQYAQAAVSALPHDRRLASKARTTSGLNTISTSDVRRLSIPVPPIEAQRAFAADIETLNAVGDRLAQQVAVLDTLFASLQYRAFRGEL
ncbi:MAG: restriction endonuclease subunit S [Galactobacter sp.]